MIGVEYAFSDTATRSEGYEESSKARSGGLKIFHRNDPFGMYSCGVTMDAS